MAMNRIGQAPNDDCARPAQIPENAVHVRVNTLFNSAHRSLSLSSGVQKYKTILGSQLTKPAWRTALAIQAVVLRNAAESIACVWIPNCCFALGNIFSGTVYTRQSRSDLIIANSVWTAVTFCTVVLASYVPLLSSLRFIQAPDSKPTVWFCLWRLIRATFRCFLIAAIIMFGFGCFAAHLSSAAPDMSKYKLECYAENLSLLIYFTGITRAVKKVYYEETCQGRERLAKKQNKPRKSDTTAATIAPEIASKSYHKAPMFWRAYVKLLPSAMPPLVATAFVHILSRQHVIDRGNTVITCFIIGSMLLKLAIQEGAKHYVLKRRVRSIRIMCVLVGVPTVLIDTQARIIFVGANDSKTAVFGTIGMALIEISMRVVKAFYVTWNISRRERLLSTQLGSQVFRGGWQSYAKHLMDSKPQHRPSLTSIHVEFEIWRRQVQSFHTAEINADMYAEYIAIGCSASVLFFYGCHPNYSLLRQSEELDTHMDMMAWRWSNLKMLLFQLGVEVVVDYISIMLEIMAGIEFEYVKSLGTFLAALFTVAAVMNINISIGVYLS